MTSKSELLYYFGSPLSMRVGLGHVACVMDVLFQEAKILNRIPVLPAGFTCPRHNRGLTREITWENYFDFSKFSRFLYNSVSENTLLTVPGNLPTENLKSCKQTRLQRDLTGEHEAYQFGEFLPSEYTLLNLPRSLRIPNYQRFEHPELWFSPSKEIRELAHLIHKRLGDYVSLKIRRNDVADECTEPPAVISFLKEHHNLTTPVFIMSDELDINYYNAIKAECNIISELDIPEFQQIWDTFNDSYLIYMTAALLSRMGSSNLGTLAPDSYLRAREAQS